MKRGILLATLLVAGSVNAATYHVAPTGRDTNPGSAKLPWKTIQRACDAVAAGDTVLVHSGRYVGRVIVKRSMTLSAAAGEKPIIDGTGIVIPEDDAGLVLIKDVSKVEIRGFEIGNYRTTLSSRCPVGIFVEGKGDQIALRNNVVHNIENNGTNAGQINALGIAVYGNSTTGAITNLVIDGNEIHSTKTGWSETVTVNGNVDGFKVTNNSVHNTNNIGIDCIGFEGTSKIAGKDQARNGLIAGNIVASVTSVSNPAYRGERSSGGIYVDGGLNILIERNVVHHADIGIEIASEHRGHDSSGVIVRNNLVYSCYVTGLSIGGYAANRGGASNCSFVGNTFYQNDTTRTGAGEFQIQFNTANNTFANNILSAGKDGVLISSQTGKNSAVGLARDSNLYFTIGKPMWNWNGHAYQSLAAYAAGTRGDSHSLYANPRFANTVTFDFRLAAGSPGIDAGKNLLALAGVSDLAGAARVQGSKIDLGAYEFTVPNP